MVDTVRLELVVVDKTQAATRKVKKNIDGINGSLGKLAKLAAAAFGIRALTQFANTVQNVNNRLKLVTTSQQNLNDTFNTLQQVANRSRGDLEGVVDLYSKIALSTKDLGISQATTSRITETFAKTLAISGADANSASGAIRQFGQALASGAFRGDEFNSVVEAAPLILDILAAETGKTRGEIRGLAADGKLTADVLINALLKSSKDVDEQFGKTSATIGQSLTVLQNNLLSLGRVASPVFEGIAKIILVVAKNVETAVVSVIAFGAALAVGKLYTFTKGIGSLRMAMSKLNLVMLRNPLLLFASAVAIAVAGVYTLLKPLLELEGALGVKLLYALEQFANNFINAFQGLGNVAIEFGKIFFESITNALTLKDPRDAFEDFGGRMKSAFQEAFEDGGPFKFVSDKDRADLEKQIEKLKNDTDKALNDPPVAITPTVSQDKLQKELEKSMEGLSSVANQIGGVFEDTFGTSYVKEMDKLEDARQKDLINLKEYHQAVAQLERKKQLATQARKKREVEDTIKLITQGQLKDIDLKNRTEDQKKAIAIGAGKEALNLAATQNEKAFKLQKALAVAQAILDAKSIILSFAKAGSVFGPIGAALGVAAGVAFTAAQISAISSASYSGPRERGGPVSPGTSYLVGEAGPEVITMGAQGGTVIPNNQMGGQVNVNFTINAIDSRGIDQVLIERKRTIVGVINEALNRRGKVGITN